MSAAPLAASAGPRAIDPIRSRDGGYADSGLELQASPTAGHRTRAAVDLHAPERTSNRTTGGRRGAGPLTCARVAASDLARAAAHADTRARAFAAAAHDAAFARSGPSAVDGAVSALPTIDVPARRSSDALHSASNRPRAG